jgi:hypothetical protein
VIRALAAAMLIPTLLAGCALPVVAPTIDVPKAPVPDAPAGDRSERGNVVKQVGETAAFGPTQDQLVVKFVVDKITVGAKCTADYAQPAERGTFVKVDMRAETDPTMPANGLYMINGWDFSTVGADGVTESDLVTGAGSSCIDPNEALSNQPFSPGSKYRGSIVLDTKNTSGVLVLKPAFMATTGGWEWQYGA